MLAISPHAHEFVFILTGTGVRAESGIPTFCGVGCSSATNNDGLIFADQRLRLGRHDDYFRRCEASGAAMRLRQGGSRLRVVGNVVRQEFQGDKAMQRYVLADCKVPIPKFEECWTSAARNIASGKTPSDNRGAPRSEPRFCPAAAFLWLYG